MLPDKFVCASNEYASYTNSVAAPVFRKSFIVDSMGSTTLTIGCTGFYDLYLNGEKITNGYLKPYISNPDRVIFYNHYDLSDKIKIGENVIGVILGNGYANPVGGAVWEHGRNHKKAPAFALECTCGNTNFGAEDMVWNRSHILFDDYRCGSYCDMTLFKREWYLSGFDDSEWNAPLVCNYSHSSKKLAECESVNEIRRIKPVEYHPGVLRDYRLSILDERGLSDSGLGDWLPVDSEADDYASPLGFCASCVLLLCLKMSIVMFDAVGMSENSEFCKVNYEKLRRAIRAEYNDNGVITKGKTEKYVKPTYRICQTSQALGLYSGIFDEEEEKNAVDTLGGLIHQNGDSFDCGFLGLRVIFHVLSKYGYSDLAYKMITKPEHPSYANMIYRGETSVWERFQPPGKRIGSHNHHFMGDVSAWYLKTIAGINVNPDCDNPHKLVINPHFVSSLDNARGSYSNKNGSARVEWMRKDGKIIVDIDTKGSLDIVLGDNLKNENCIVSCNKK